MFEHVYCIPYKRNEEIHLNENKDRQKIILFYGRRTAARNLFELAVDGISLWQQRNPTIARDWQIISVGEDYPVDAVSQLNNFKNLGKLSLEDYIVQGTSKNIPLWCDDRRSSSQRGRSFNPWPFIEAA
jgi:hypothetical protein